MDRLQQMEDLVVSAKRMADHGMQPVFGDLQDHILISRDLACEFLRKTVEYQINFPQLEEVCHYRNQR